MRPRTLIAQVYGLAAVTTTTHWPVPPFIEITAIAITQEEFDVAEARNRGNKKGNVIRLPYNYI